MFEKLAETVEQGLKLREVGPQRSEFGGIPRRSKQTNWRMAVVAGDSGEKFLRIGTADRAFNFKITPEALKKQEAMDGKCLPLERMSDLIDSDLESGGKAISKGTFQVHRSEPSLIHGTFQDGRKGVSFELSEHEGQWRLVPRAPKPHNNASAAVRFAEKLTGVNKSAAPEADRSKLPFREGVDAIIGDGDNVIGQILTNKNTGHRYPKFPGGGIDPGESPDEALTRELMEEVGATHKGDLVNHGTTNSVWPPTFVVDDKTRDRYAQFQGSRRHVFSGRLASVGAPTSTEGDAWTAAHRVPLSEMTEFVQKMHDDEPNPEFKAQRAVQLLALKHLATSQKEASGEKGWHGVADVVWGDQAKVGSWATKIREALAAKIRAAEKLVHLTPTEPQKEVGNYRKGHVWIQGLDITIENPAGSERSGTAPDGKKWSQEMKNSYGYIRNFPRSRRDKDHMDVFLGDHHESELAFVIDQEYGGKFDEHKTVLGATNEKQAREIYLANYQKGWKGLGAITSLTMPQFKRWLTDGDTGKPLAGAQMSEFSKKAGIGRAVVHCNGCGADMESKMIVSDPDRKREIEHCEYCKEKRANLLDTLTWPLHAENPAAGIAVGTAAGAGIGAGVGLYHRLRHKFLGGPAPDETEIGRDTAAGAAIGLGTSGLFQLMGKNPYTYPGSPLYQSRHPEYFPDLSKEIAAPNLPAANTPTPTAKVATDGYSLKLQIENDGSLPEFRKQQMIAEVEIAATQGTDLTPEALMDAGLSSLAAWMLSRQSGYSPMGMMMGGLGSSLYGGFGGEQKKDVGFYRM